jgi:uncharacterized protein (TIGR02611 family)
MLSKLRSGLKVIAGFLLLIVGGILSLPGVPGPGIVIIIFGLWLLSDHFDWAKRALAWAREKLDRLKQKRRSASPDSTQSH